MKDVTKIVRETENRKKCRACPLVSFIIVFDITKY